MSNRTEMRSWSSPPQSDPRSVVPPRRAYHSARCACVVCGAHVVTGVGYKIAGNCPNCGSYDLVELDALTGADRP